MNNSSFELHLLDWIQFLGPQAKLNKTLFREHVGMNPLDKTGNKNDIWYRDLIKEEKLWLLLNSKTKWFWTDFSLMNNFL